MQSNGLLILSKLGKASVTNYYTIIGNVCGKVLSNVNARLTKIVTREFSLYEKRQFYEEINFNSHKVNIFKFSTGSNKNVSSDGLGDEDLDSDNSDDEEEEQTQEEYFKEIANNDPEVEKKLKILQLEVEVIRQECGRAPLKMNKLNWEELLRLPSSTSRKKYLKFLFIVEHKKNNEKERKKIKSEKKRSIYNKVLEGAHLPYGFNGYNMFIRIFKKTINQNSNGRLLAAMLYSQHVVFDCSYGDYMTKLNSKYCAKQLFTIFSDSRKHPAPLHVKLCNANKNDEAMIKLNKMMMGLCEKNFPWDIHEESYLDLYPKEKLVYLTPHTNTELIHFSHDDVYVIGAFVDRGTGEKVSLAKAKESNMRMAKLPIDRFINWEKGNKCLPLNIVMNILLDMRLYNDWKRAFMVNIPHRFLIPSTPKMLIRKNHF